LISRYSSFRICAMYSDLVGVEGRFAVSSAELVSALTEFDRKMNRDLRPLALVARTAGLKDAILQLTKRNGVMNISSCMTMKETGKDVTTMKKNKAARRQQAAV
jgi:hypothetical protein